MHIDVIGLACMVVCYGSGHNTRDDVRNCVRDNAHKKCRVLRARYDFDE